NRFTQTTRTGATSAARCEGIALIEGGRAASIERGRGKASDASRIRSPLIPARNGCCAARKGLFTVSCPLRAAKSCDFEIYDPIWFWHRGCRVEEHSRQRSRECSRPSPGRTP